MTKLRRHWIRTDSVFEMSINWQVLGHDMPVSDEASSSSDKIVFDTSTVKLSPRLRAKDIADSCYDLTVLSLTTNHDSRTRRRIRKTACVAAEKAQIDGGVSSNGREALQVWCLKAEGLPLFGATTIAVSPVPNMSWCWMNEAKQHTSGGHMSWYFGNKLVRPMDDMKLRFMMKPQLLKSRRMFASAILMKRNTRQNSRLSSVVASSVQMGRYWT